MKKSILLSIILLLALSLSACSGLLGGQSTQVDTTETSDSLATGDSATGSDTSSGVNALADNSEVHANAADYEWDSAAVIPITLDGNAITTSAKGVSISGNVATITAAGTYSISGSLPDGRIIVDTEDEQVVRLILAGVNISSATSSPLFISKAEKVVIILAENTNNSLADASSYVYANSDEDEPNAVIFSKADLTIAGNGSLTITGNFNDGISSKDGLIIAGGNIAIQSADDGIRGKDYVVMTSGTLAISAAGDGMKSDNDEDTTLGFITIQSGTVNIAAGGDAITAQTDVLIEDGVILLTSGGGSYSQVDETTSAKGIKGVVNVTINGGTFNINAADDAIHSNDTIVIQGGDFIMASGDDGLHADANLIVNSGKITITQCYEGLESAVITINDGMIDIIASDDGLNVAGGKDASGMNPGWGPGGGGGKPGGGPGQDNFTSTGDYYLYINGGRIVVDAMGDGVDVNGAVVMTGGTLIVNGPTSQGNGALDYDRGFNISGGVLVAAGSSGMAMAPGESSSQYSVLINFESTLPAGTLVHIQNSVGQDILSFAAIREIQSIAFSSAALVNGETYDVYYGGSSSGTGSDGYFEGGSYSPGNLYTSFTISGVVTQIGTRGGNRH